MIRVIYRSQWEISLTLRGCALFMRVLMTACNGSRFVVGGNAPVFCRQFELLSTRPFSRASSAL